MKQSMGKKVMLIQDDSDCKDIMKYILEEEGFEVSTQDIKTELENQSYDFDLVIIDEYAEGKTGCEICKQIKNNTDTCNKPVILSSTAIGVESSAHVSKADAFLAKPFDICYFVELIRSLYLTRGILC